MNKRVLIIAAILAVILVTTIAYAFNTVVIEQAVGEAISIGDSVFVEVIRK